MFKSVAVWSLLLVSTTILFSSCVSNAKIIESGDYDFSKVPADFNPKKHILLVAEIPKKNKPDERLEGKTKKLDEAMRAFYPYRYEIVSIRDIVERKGKYSDTSVYRFAVRNNISFVTHETSTQYKSHFTGTYRNLETSTQQGWVDFGFYDRVTEKRFPLSGNSNPSIKYATLTLAELIKRAKP